MRIYPDSCSEPLLVGWHHQSLLGSREPTLLWNQLRSLSKAGILRLTRRFCSRKTGSVHRVCAAVNDRRRSWKARRRRLIWRLRHVGRRHSDNLVCSFGPTFSCQLLKKRVPTIGADVVFLVFDYSLSTIPNLIAQIASVHQHDTHLSSDTTAGFSTRQACNADRHTPTIPQLT